MAELAGAAAPFIDFRDVWLAYNDELLAQRQFAVEAIDLQVAQGEFIAIVGPSGCGKSTFMKLATGLKRPSRGSIVIDGREVDGPLKISGMAFQAPSLLPWRTTLDNVLLPLEIVEPYRSQFRSKRAEYAERARALLRQAWAAMTVWNSTSRAQMAEGAGNTNSDTSNTRHTSSHSRAMMAISTKGEARSTSLRRGVLMAPPPRRAGAWRRCVRAARARFR